MSHDTPSHETSPQRLTRREKLLATVASVAAGLVVATGYGILQNGGNTPHKPEGRSAVACGTAEIGGAKSGWTLGAAHEANDAAKHAAAEKLGVAPSRVDALPDWNNDTAAAEMAGKENKYPDKKDTFETCGKLILNKRGIPVEYVVEDAKIIDVVNTR
ncbi:hypothetical protein KBD87_02180 [Candidatus Saccharibacteria bacterium]|nr:hypothetical protein [Candidatus Saccharibacteria bacterium]